MQQRMTFQEGVPHKRKTAESLKEIKILYSEKKKKKVSNGLLFYFRLDGTVLHLIKTRGKSRTGS